MSNVYFLLVAIAVPVLFFVLIWTVVTAYRLLFPEEGRAYEEAPVVVRHKATVQGASVPVGAREIREDQRYFFSANPPSFYVYAFGESNGVPEIWHEDLWRRKN